MCSSRNRFRKAAQPNSQQMIDRQLAQLNGHNNDTEQGYPPVDPNPLPLSVNSPRAISHITWADAIGIDVEHDKGTIPTKERPQKDGKDKRSGSGSSESSSGATSDQEFLPTLVVLPAHPQPASSSTGSHRRITSIPGMFKGEKK